MIFDIDNIIIIFINLLMINIIIKISIVSNLIRNLKENIHLTYQKVSLYHISHFHLNYFEHDFKFDLYIILSIFYDKKRKWERENLYNYILKKIRVKFMNIYFLLTIEEMIDNNDNQSWDLRYDISKIKSIIITRENNIYHKKSSEFHREILKNLNFKYIDLIWRNCERRL